MREYTCMLLDMAENGMLSWEALAREALSYMSEDDVKDMASAFMEEDEEEEEEEEGGDA